MPENKLLKNETFLTARATASRRSSRLRTQAECCKLFAVCFYPPDRKLLAEENISDNLRCLLQEVCPTAASLAPSVGPYLEGEAGTDLAVAYTRLFLGQPSLLASPYATYYLDRPGAVMGPASLAMAKIYTAMGLRLDADFNEMPDHVTVVLEFLYYLLFKSAVPEFDAGPEEMAAIERVREDFLNRFVLTWIPRFCDAVRTADQHPFYSGVAQALDIFIRNGLEADDVSV